jgi:hypothetical protein
MFVLVACGDDEDTDSTGDTAEETAGIAVGEPAPDFVLPEARGGDISLSQYTSDNQAVLLFFHMGEG